MYTHTLTRLGQRCLYVPLTDGERVSALHRLQRWGGRVSFHHTRLPFAKHEYLPPCSHFKQNQIVFGDKLHLRSMSVMGEWHLKNSCHLSGGLRGHRQGPHMSATSLKLDFWTFCWRPRCQHVSHASSLTHNRHLCLLHPSSPPHPQCISLVHVCLRQHSSLQLVSWP